MFHAARRVFCRDLKLCVHMPPTLPYPSVYERLHCLGAHGPRSLNLSLVCILLIGTTTVLDMQDNRTITSHLQQCNGRNLLGLHLFFMKD